MINRAKFDACISSTFRGIKTGTQTDRIALYGINFWHVSDRHIASERAANNIAPDGGLIEVASQLCRYYFLHGNIAIALFQHNYYLRSWKLCVIIRFFSHAIAFTSGRVEI